MERENFIQELSLKNNITKFYEILKNKNYEGIYELYGKQAYLLFAPRQYKKDDINRLMSEKKYGELYSKYGKLETFFVKDLRKLKKTEIKMLEKQGHYEEIYEQYGENEYNKKIHTYKPYDIYNETGKKSKLVLYKAKHYSAKGLKNILKIASIVPISSMVLLGGVNIYNQNVAAKNTELYASELQAYTENLSEYADYINSLNLDDTQIIAKVLYDEWSSIEGYGEPKSDIFGLWRLDLSNENATGKCRQLADNFSATMNAINPEYNARNLIVYQDTNYYGYNSIANIYRNITDTPYENLAPDKYVDLSVEANPNLKDENDNSIPLKISKIDNTQKLSMDNFKVSVNMTQDEYNQTIGNHVITIMDIPNQKLPIVVDATNPSIGVLKDGKIIMLSTIEGKGIEHVPIGEIFFNSVNTNIKYYADNLKSYLSDESIEELKDKYGTDALNKALNEVINITNNNSHKMK